MSLPLCAVAAIPEGDHMRVIAAGEIDLATAPLLRHELDELITAGWLDITVDLRETTFADSSALHGLLDAYRRVQGLGGDLDVTVEHGPIADLMTISGVDRTLRITQPEAIR